MPGIRIYREDVLPDPAELFVRAEEQGFISDCLRRLSRREATILALRFGIGDEPPRSFEEVAVKVGLSLEETQATAELALSRLADMPEMVAYAKRHGLSLPPEPEPFRLGPRQRLSGLAHRS